MPGERVALQHGTEPEYLFDIGRVSFITTVPEFLFLRMNPSNSSSIKAFTNGGQAGAQFDGQSSLHEPLPFFELAVQDGVANLAMGARGTWSVSNLRASMS